MTPMTPPKDTQWLDNVGRLGKECLSMQDSEFIDPALQLIAVEIPRLIAEIRRMDKLNTMLQAESIPAITPGKLRLSGLTERVRITLTRLSYRFKHAENLYELHVQIKDSHGVLGEWLRAYGRLSK